jgi:hypothetical protein
MENYDTCDADTNEKAIFTGTAVYKSKKKSDFPICVKLGVGSDLDPFPDRHKMESRIRNERHQIDADSQN